MHILLTHNVPYLGKPGDLVRVRPGYARNYLLPQGLATFATPHNLRIVERHRERLRQLEQAFAKESVAVYTLQAAISVQNALAP